MLSLLLAAIIAAGSPAKASGRRPDWIDRESAEWPREMYLLGVGSADERAVAEDRARADLARIFSTRVSSVLASNASESSVRNARGEAHSEQISVSEETRSTTEKVLEGVEIVQVWQDPDTHQTYALAALDRQQAAARLQARFDDLEKAAAPLRARLRAPDKAAALGAAMRLFRLERERRDLDGELRIVAPSRAGHGFANEDGARDLLSRTSVSLAISGDDGGVIQDALSTALTGLGFPVKPEATDTDLVGEARIALEDLGSRDGWYWSRGRVELVVRERASARVVVSVTESVRDAARVEGESSRRVLRKVSDKLRQSVPAAFLSAGDNL